MPHSQASTVFRYSTMSFTIMITQHWAIFDYHIHHHDPLPLVHHDESQLRYWYLISEAKQPWPVTQEPYVLNHHMYVIVNHSQIAKEFMIDLLPQQTTQVTWSSEPQAAWTSSCLITIAMINHHGVINLNSSTTNHHKSSSTSNHHDSSNHHEAPTILSCIAAHRCCSGGIPLLPPGSAQPLGAPGGRAVRTAGAETLGTPRPRGVVLIPRWFMVNLNGCGIFV